MLGGTNQHVGTYTVVLDGTFFGPIRSSMALRNRGGGYLWRHFFNAGNDNDDMTASLVVSRWFIEVLEGKHQGVLARMRAAFPLKTGCIGGPL